MAKENFELFVVDPFDDEDESLPTLELPAEKLEIQQEGYNYNLGWKDAT